MVVPVLGVLRLARASSAADMARLASVEALQVALVAIWVQVLAAQAVLWASTVELELLDRAFSSVGLPPTPHPAILA
jgi:hypothetical protein